MNKTILKTAIILGLSALSLNASCLNMSNSLVCDFDDETVKNSHKINGVKYDIYNQNKGINSIEVNLKNSSETLYLNLSSYPNLREVKVIKNRTSKAYIKLKDTVIKIEDKGIKDDTK